ncbi:Putative beta-lactamase-inhibitor-like, PepSY-like [Pedobacter steynii]|uniref:Putative beta-lactamase-inhibitor-like, PepSY-like n=1 Tax=Pedobacter steynii TaxID=430522 RepID=A0A1H0B3Q0_9SPHI|nr:PepSY-like domain-containing protein [Pedobacter steynii]NQX41169.1 PepSY-like domain-containing protein [Pedobacter steynii]SDN40278.1 Putative beta-lactamase-inhibitor-like, PepSY-like [Pedobacter steynii]
MKQSIILAAGLLFSGLTYAQDIPVKEVPSVVLNSFSKAFPQAVKVDWEKKGDLFNADFDIGRRDHEVWLNHKGAIVKYKKELRSRELPSVVANSIKKNFKGFRIDDVDKYEEEKQFFYKVELKTLSEEKKVVFDAQGKISNRIL